MNDHNSQCPIIRDKHKITKLIRCGESFWAYDNVRNKIYVYYGEELRRTIDADHTPNIKAWICKSPAKIVPVGKRTFQ